MPSKSRGRQPLALLSVVVVLVVAGFTAMNLRPGLWFTESTPTGGDLGAHVWGPAYLRDVLIPQWRVTGWTHDWYAGFPAFTFYMVVPALLVVIANVGLAIKVSVFAVLGAGAASAALAHSLSRRLQPWAPKPKRRLTLVLAAAAGAIAALVLNLVDGAELGLGALGELAYDDALVDRSLGALMWPTACGYGVWCLLRSRPRIRLASAVVAGLVALGTVPLPYGASLKLIAIIGVVLLPAASWAMARAAGVSASVQALFAATTLLFIFDQSFNIYGGNLMSTMAGEFAYTLGLGCAMVYIGVATTGMDRDRHRILAGVLLALTGLAHLFTAFFALGATAALIVAPPLRRPRLAALRRRVTWTLATGALGAALSAWWVLPFWWNRALLNDMGWGKDERYLSGLWSRSEFDYDFLVNWPPLQVFVVLAVIGFVISVVRRIRLGTALAITAAMLAAAFILLPEGRLWNVRIVPFYYLSVYLLAGLCVAEMSGIIGRLVERLILRRTARSALAPEFSDSADSGAARRWCTAVSGFLLAVSVAAVLVTVALPMRALPGGRLAGDGEYKWGPLSTRTYNLGPFWVQYNFEGYENRDPNDKGGGSPEYWDLMHTMKLIGQSRGCGTSLWEYEADRLGSYGTPMAPMLLPYWTERCIGSMEGLYFEASATTPYHFLMQSELSASPSRAQRELPYASLDIDAGVEHMQLMGVRYYMAFSSSAIAGARANETLQEITRTGPWVVFELPHSRAATGLSVLPVVLEGLDSSENSWLIPSVAVFNAGADRPVLAADGPAEWPRMALPSLADEDPVTGEERSGDDYDRRRVMRRLSEELPAEAPVVEVVVANVSDVKRSDHSISFTVDRTGLPVLVRTSYFPNWRASGAQGPYRVSPNQMVVVPTEHEVRLHYGRSGVESASAAMSLGALALIVWLSLRRRRPAPVDMTAPPVPTLR